MITLHDCGRTRQARRIARSVNTAILIATMIVCAEAAASPRRALGAAGTAPTSQASAIAATAHELGYSLAPSTTEPYAACPPAKPGFAQCFSIITPPGAVEGLGTGKAMALEGGGEDKGWAPVELREAYGIAGKSEPGQTVAIVDAYDDAHANADLKAYRERYKIEPACTEENGCFKRVNQSGVKGEYPEAAPPESIWPMEVATDIEMVSAICPECHILLVEANSSELSELYAAEKTAAEPALGATEISNSWGGEEISEETKEDELFNHPGIPITVASGDLGGKYAFYPATSKDVIAVGGTDLKKAEKTTERPRGWEEQAWDGTSGGCSAVESRPPWQEDWACSLRRTDNDVAAVASTESPVSIYDLGWKLGDGTSVAAPIVAAIEAYASKAVRNEPGAEAFYRHALYDVTLGSDTVYCGVTYVCTAEEGYDGPTGWGTMDGPLALAVGFRAITGGASGATRTGVTLNGEVFPEASEISYRFEYGQTTAYGNSVPLPSGKISTGVTWATVSQSLSGLEEARTYHYRLVASSASGTVYGQDYTFATVPWGTQATATPTGTSEETYNGYLNGTSCSSSTACTGVGWYENSARNGVTLAERWNGSTWAVQTTQNQEGGKSEKLSGVSCPSSTACTAVGYYTSAGTVVTLAEQWSSGSWALQTTLNPEGAKGSELKAVSCGTATVCFAVGRYYTKISEETGKAEYKPLVERWAAGKWTLQPVPTPEGAKYTELRGISCTSAEVCTMVGTLTGGAGKTVALRRSGEEWTSQEMPSTAKLVSVSCVAAETCTAVGSGLTAARWNGKEWAVESMPSPVGPRESDLFSNGNTVESVSCSSITQCVAVGKLEREDEETTMAELWNGVEWSVEGAPRPTHGVLYGVSCPSSIMCAAAGTELGYKYKGSDHTVTLAEGATLPPTNRPAVETKTAGSTTTSGATLNGGVDPEGAETKFYFEYGLEREKYEHKTAEIGAGFYRSKAEESQAITGLTLGTTYHFRIVASNAYGVSYGEDHTFTTPLWSLRGALGGTGAKWSALRRVSCANAGECIAVGAYDSSAGVESALGERWSGSEWALQATPSPAGAKWAALAGVSCASTTACSAVGRYENSSKAEVTLAERWSGSEWAIQSTANPSGARSSWLEAVSCTSSSACTGVGRYENSSKVEVTLAERWNGSEWAIQATPNPTGAKWSRLADVSCSSATSCVAVGSYQSSAGARQTLAESWNGSEWSIPSTPNPAGSEWNALKGVSCVSASECTAVGGDQIGSKYMTLVEHASGSSWSIQSTPEPAVGELLSVSCPTASWCAATGTNEGKEPLAEHWNGSEWTEQLTTIPAGIAVSALEGVSCTTTCLAVGYAYTEASTPSPLSESYPLRPPYTKSVPASGLGETQATIRGLVNPGGAEAKYWFEYGPTATYGTKTSEVSAGSGMSNLEESSTITGLTAGSSYHFRLVAKNSEGTSYGEDMTFSAGTPGELSGMAVTDPFNGTTSAVSSFTSNWAALGWAAEKGLDRTTGWGPSAAYPTVTGAYFLPAVTDVGSGVADVATMSEAPNAEGRYFSLWLDMSSAGSTRSGYQLTFTDVTTGTYEVKLSKWVSGSQTVLASKSGYAFASGGSLALVDIGSMVSAWTNTGSGFGELLSASDATFAGGNSGIEGAGNLMRLSNFKVGELLKPVANMNAALAALALNDSFATSESPLSDGGAFAALSWDSGTSGHNTGRVESGWGPYDAYSTINGAYWQRTSFADTGAGDAAAATLTVGPANVGRYFALWLNMPSPGSARSGYELRLTERSSGSYEVDLSKWVAGVETTLASKLSYSFPVKSQLALVDDGGTVAAWTDTASEYTQLLSASDATYTNGYTGIEGSGNIERLTEFRGGPLAPT